MKARVIKVTNHFSPEEEDLIGWLSLSPGVTIPADAVFVAGGSIVRHKQTDSFTVTELAMMSDTHYKHFLDNLPNSCVAAGGHIRDKKGNCKLCKARVRVE